MALDDISWEQVYRDLDAEGNAVIKSILSPDECDEIRALYQKEKIFRSQVVMERHGFGRGEYRYFSYPLPDRITAMRTSLYPHLVPIANRWNEAMGIDVRYPPRMRSTFNAAIRRARISQHRCSSSTEPTITTVCTRICMASMFSRSRSQCCCQNRIEISLAASL
jgi:hypothetical protein